MDSETLTALEACNVAGFSRSFLYRIVKSDPTVPHRKRPDGTREFPRAEFEAWANKRRVRQRAAEVERRLRTIGDDLEPMIKALGDGLRRLENASVAIGHVRKDAAAGGKQAKRAVSVINAIEAACDACFDQAQIVRGALESLGAEV